MKNAIEQMFSYMVVIFILFLFTSFFYIEFKAIKARNSHSVVVHRLQSEGTYSDEVIVNYQDTYKEYIFIKEENGVYVEYKYDVTVPFLGTIHDLKVVGYAR